MVFLVADVDESERVRGDAPRVAELAVGRALAAEGAQEVAGGVEDLHAVVVAVGDDVLADAVHGHAGQAVELAVAVAVAAEAERVLAVGGEHLKSVS